MTGNNSNFDNLFNSINDFIFILDLQGAILAVNNSVVEQLGYDREELHGQSVLMVHPPEFREKAAEVVLKMISGELDSCNIPLITKNNIYLPVETKIYKGVWDEKEVLFGLSRNLSEISLSEEKFFKVFDNNNLLMAISDIHTGVFINVNNSFLETLGYEMSEVIGKTAGDLHLFYDKSQRAEILSEMKDKDSLSNVYVKVRKKNNQILHASFSISKLQIQTYQFILTSCYDITALKESERKQELSLKRQSLLADISQELLSIENLENKLSNIIQRIGIHTNVSRVYIFRDSEDSLVTTNTHEWCNIGITPQINELQNIPYEIIPSWKKILKSKGRIFTNDIHELPEDLVSVLEPQEIKSILVYPFIVYGKIIGFIGFDECVLTRDWEIEDIELLRSISGIISNSYERKIYQEQLALSELQLKLALENTEAGLWDWNIPTGKVYFSKIWCEMLGYSQEEIEPNVSSWEKLVHPEDMPEVMEVLNLHLSGITPSYMTTHRVLTKSGKWKWILDKGKVIERNENDEPVRAIGTHIDIDGQKENEEKIKHSLNQQTLLAEISQSLLSFENLEEKFVHIFKLIGNHSKIEKIRILLHNVDDKSFSLVHEWHADGITPSTIFKMNYGYDIYHKLVNLCIQNHQIVDSDFADDGNKFIQILRNSGIISTLGIPLFVNNELFGIVSFNTCNIKKYWNDDEIGFLKILAGIISNSYERRLFQEKLAESELQLKLAMENTNTGFWDCNIQTGQIFYSDIWCRMLGYEPNEIEQRVETWEAMIHPDDHDETMKILNAHLEGKTPIYESQHRLRTKSGNWLWIIDKGKIVEYDSDVKPIRAIGTQIDINKQKQTEIELAALNATKDKLFSIIAHDLRGPMATMMQISEMVAEKDMLDEETFNLFIESQKELTQNTFQLLDNLLHWAKANRDNFVYNPKMIILSEIFDKNIQNFKFNLNQKNISLERMFSQNIRALADEDMINLVIRNILSNALKYTPVNGKIQIQIESVGKHVKVKISDNGVGISKENIDRILTENDFYTTYGTNNEKGTGLGLKLCKNFIEINKGKLSIESTPGKGSSFIFTIPKK